MTSRVAFLDALEAAVARAAAEDARLAVALVTATPPAREVPALVRELACSEVYDVGPGAYAVVLGGAGRADALGLLAKLEARCGARGTAVERTDGETALELYVRVLTGGRPAEGSATGRAAVP